MNLGDFVTLSNITLEELSRSVYLSTNQPTTYHAIQPLHPTFVT